MAKKKEVKKEVKKLNPFDIGVTYEAFCKELGSSKVEDYLKGVCSDEQIEWIKKELINYKKK